MARLLVRLFAFVLLAASVHAQPPPAVTATDLGAGPPAAQVNERGDVLLPRGHSTFFWSPASGLVDLGAIDEFPPVTHGRDLNDLGHVVGDFRGRNGNLAPFLWSLTGGLIDLTGGDADGPEAPANTINNAVEVAGGDLASSRAFRWTSTGGIISINPLDGCCGSAGLDINRWGDIAGVSSVYGRGEDDYEAFVWLRSGVVIDLGNLGGYRSQAIAINDVGQVTGWSTTRDAPPAGWPEPLYLRHGFFWSERDGMVDIGTLGGAWSNPTAINDFGEVVGISETASGAVHAFHWSRAAGMSDLGPGSAVSINNMGQVAGDAEVDGRRYAVVWSSTGSVVLAENATARDINDRGDVAGGTLGSDPHAMLWHVPVPLAERIRFYEAQLLVGRYGGLLTQGDIAPIRAALRQARKFLAAGKTRQAEQALTRAASLLVRLRLRD